MFARTLYEGTICAFGSSKKFLHVAIPFVVRTFFLPSWLVSVTAARKEKDFCKPQNRHDQEGRYSLIAVRPFASDPQAYTSGPGHDLFLTS